jgi:diacylglycerol O-acyltransferase / wax synthase
VTRLTPLSATDAAFLHQETGAAHMSVGGLARFNGPGPTIEELRAHTLRRLHLIPRYRQRLVHPPAGIGRPLWSDDPDFDVAFHVRHEVLPAPGGDDELWDLFARVWAERIDRSRPLWELYLVEGLRDGQFAIIAKNHHALTDGISNIDVLNALWDLEPAPAPSDRDSDRAWEPEAESSAGERVTAGVSEAAGSAAALARGAADLVRHPRAAARLAARAVEGVAEVG